MLTISILFSTFDYLTIFSIFWLDILLTIFSLDSSYSFNLAAISSGLFFNFFKLDLSILDLLSTISWWRLEIRYTKGNLSSLLLSLFDQILCLANISRLYLIYSGISNSTSDKEAIDHFWVKACLIFSIRTIKRFTYSIRMSSPVIIIFCFSVGDFGSNVSSSCCTILCLGVSGYGVGLSIVGDTSIIGSITDSSCLTEVS